MKKTLTILVCKLARWAGKLLGRGSSLPGQIALKLCPDILSRIQLPPYVVAVTGSNGKTSTVEMIAHILRRSGRKVAYNKEGSNQIEGVATFLLCDCTLGGRVKSDVVLMESDERFARHTFRSVVPTHYVITNLYRDQLTRNGHPEWMYDIVAQSIYPQTQLILNADDPLVARFGYGRDNVVWFGADPLESDRAENDSVYNDGAYCPNCLEPMEYSRYHYNHIGHYRCTHCGFARPETQYAITAADFAAGYLELDGAARIHTTFNGIYHFYNNLAAYALCRELGVEGDAIVKSMDGYAMTSGRVVQFQAGDKLGTLLTSKHENSVSYDRSIDVCVQSGEPCTVMVLVDAISRKYFTSETSWLWDVDFEKLSAPNVRRVILTGMYANDLAVRFDDCGIPSERIRVIPSIDEAVDVLAGEAEEHCYVITCFSDKEKLLSRVSVEGGK